MASLNFTSTFYHSERSIVPKLVGVMFAEFDADLGPVLTYQVNSNLHLLTYLLLTFIKNFLTKFSFL